MTKILIIGGGVIGLAIARELRKKEIGQITILERGTAGREASFAAAGMLAPQSEADQPDDFFRFCDESNRLYPRFARELLDETGIDIELDRSGTLYLAFTEPDSEEVRRRFEWQSRAGLPIEHLTAQSICRTEPFVSPDVREGLYFPNDHQVENRELLSALIRFARLNQIEIVEGAEVQTLLTNNGKITGAEATGKSYPADVVILATGAWSSLIKTDTRLAVVPPVKPIRGQMLGFRTAKRLFSKVIVSPRGYLVPRRLGRILAGSTVEDAGFEKATTEAGVDIIRQNSYEIAPAISNLKITEKWSGLRPFGRDGLPIIGAAGAGLENLFIATAHYRNGILLAPLTAEIMAARIADNVASRYLDIYGPGRYFGAEKQAAT